MSRFPHRSAFLFPALFLLFAACAPPPPVVTGTLEGTVHWQGEVRLAGDVVLAEGAELVVAPGTEVVFLPSTAEERSEHPYFPGSELIVRGRLRAVGKPEAPIVFRYVDAGAPPGSWGGINLEGSPEAVFRFCRFTQADSALHCRQSKVTVSQSVFERNLVGVRFHDTDLLLEHNLLRQNGAAVRFHFGAPVIRHNDIRDNEKGLFITSFPRNYRIEENNFTGNSPYNVVLGEQVPQDVDLSGNWWGSEREEEIEAGFFDGRIDGYLGRICYRPFASAPFASGGISWKP